jgi:hypothetical protein
MYSLITTNMKLYLAILMSVCSTLTLSAQSDSLGLPGDDLDLCGVLELFKTSKSPDEFEKALNKKDSKINNLDLNTDGKVDYLRVIDNSKGDAHALIIRDVVSSSESQDVAVIEIEKKGEKNAQLQIVGDEELYGKDFIIEPKTEKSSTEGKWQGFAPQIIIVNVWYWPCVSYLWYPDYVVWVSPWYWGYYPAWWYPWAPMPYYTYYDYVYVYHDYYYWTDDYRCTQAHSVYQPRRVVSSEVHQRVAPAQRQVAQREKTSPRRTPGAQNPVPGKRGGAKKESTPRETPKDRTTPPGPQRETPKDRTTPPAPQKKEAPKDRTTPPAPQRQPEQNPPAPERKQPQQTETPKQNPTPAPAPRHEERTPRPQRQPDVRQPSPRPAPAPRPPRQQPSPRPRPR